MDSLLFIVIALSCIVLSLLDESHNSKDISEDITDDKLY